MTALGFRPPSLTHPAFPSLITIHTTKRQHIKTGSDLVDQGCCIWIIRAFRGKQEKKKKDHTGRQRRELLHNHLPPRHVALQTDRHSFSRAQARQMNQSIKKILMKLNHGGSC